MARNKEICYLLVDVGPLMHQSLPCLSQALTSFVESKMLTKPTHEMSLTFYGTTGTRNPLNSDMAASGEPNQYEHIILEHDLMPPDVDFLRTLKTLPKGTGRSDFLDVLTLGVNGIFENVRERLELNKNSVLKRIVLVSNFAREVKQDEGTENFVQALVEKMQEAGITLDVLMCEDSEHKPDKHNLELVDKFLAGVRHTFRRVTDPVEILSAFQAKEYSATAWYTGPFSLSDKMNIAVKVCKKVAQERLPTTAKYSEEAQGEDAKHTVTRETEYRSITNADEEAVELEERVKGYKYGKQLVPISREDEAYLKYECAKGMQLLSFIPTDQVPRQAFMKDNWVVVPEKKNDKAGKAMSALVQAMLRTQSAAIIRFVPRAGQAVHVCCATPVAGSMQQPAHLVMNHLPFTEDVRTYQFHSFDKRPELIPSAEQLGLARRVVDALDLSSGPQEKLKPERTVNPLYRRFVSFMAARAVEPEAQVPSQDLLLERTIDCPESDAGAARDVLEQLPKKFKLQAKANGAASQGVASQEEKRAFLGAEPAAFSLAGGAPASRVEAVGTSSPVEDFRAMLAQEGGREGAISGIQGVIVTLVDTSLGDRFYEKALRCVKALRSASVELGRGREFNSWLEGLCSRYEHHAVHAAFWRLALAEGLLPISDEEVPGTGLSEEAARSFFARHEEVQVAPQPAAPMEVEEDEFADMD